MLNRSDTINQNKSPARSNQRLIKKYPILHANELDDYGDVFLKATDVNKIKLFIQTWDLSQMNCRTLI